jgi:hypothetical protein
MSAGARQADDGPVVVGQTQGELRSLIVDRFDLSADLSYQYRRNSTESTFTGERTDTEHKVQETLTAVGRVFFGHKNLADLTFDATIGFENRFRDSPNLNLDDDQNDLLALFRTDLLILGQSSTPMRVWALRNQRLLEREFASSVESSTTEAGASVRAFLDTVPTTLRYYHREREQDDLGGTADFNRVEDTFELQSVWRPNRDQGLSFDYAVDFVDEDQASGFNDTFTRHDATLTHTLDFGGRRRLNNLRSTLRVFDQSGISANSTVRLDEILRLQHTESLDSRWNLILEDRSVGGQDQQQARGSTILRHKLFDSLVTTLESGGGHQRIDSVSFTRDDYYVGVNLEYNKLVPYGRLDASFTERFDRVENSDRGTQIDFVNTVHTFNDPFPVVINQRFIIPTSILIRDIAGIQVFVEGVDYTVLGFPDRVEITRQVGGSIADGETVLIDYSIGPEPENTTDTLTTSVTVRYDIDRGPLRGFSVFYLFRDLDQSIDAPMGSLIIANDVRQTRYGAEYKLGDFTFLAEQEERDSDVSPFELTRISARFNRSVGPGSWVSLDASHEDISYTDTGNDVVLDRITGEWSSRTGKNTLFRLRLNYRDEDERLGGNTTGFEQTVELNWKYRQTSMFVSATNSFLEGDDVDSDAQTIAIGLSRRF